MRIAPADHHRRRQAALVASLPAAGVDALLVSTPSNIAYLTGFFGSAGLLVAGPAGFRLIVDGRYRSVAASRQRDLPHLVIVPVPTDASYEEVAARELAATDARRIGAEGSHLTVSRWRDIESRTARAQPATTFVVTAGLVECLRAVKDDWELGRLREGGARLSDAAKCIMPKVLAGATEHEVTGLVEQALRRVGFERPAFDTIVASGPNGAMPHYRSGERRLEDGDLVIVDFGGVLDGYAVDLTRTVPVGTINTRARQVLGHVAEAQAAAFRSVRAGQPAHEVDRAARQVLEQVGLGEAFAHATGHGLGLDVHERPRIARWRAGQPDEPLEAGIVCTLEPGAYIEGWGGVRIEDDVLVTPVGAEWLTDVPAAGR